MHDNFPGKNIPSFTQMGVKKTYFLSYFGFIKKILKWPKPKIKCTKRREYDEENDLVRKIDFFVY